VLVCKACSQRSSGPKGLKSKKFAQTLAKALRGAAPRPRVLLTTCQGVCPKRALCVTTVGGDGPARVHLCATRADAALVTATLSEP
jgi:hypothetical protein